MLKSVSSLPAVRPNLSSSRPVEEERGEDRVEVSVPEAGRSSLQNLLSARRFGVVGSSPEGRQVAYLENGLKVQDSQGTVRTLYPGRVGGYQWLSEDLLAFSYDRQGDERWALALARADGQGKLTRITHRTDAVHQICFVHQGELFYRTNARNGTDYDLRAFDPSSRQHREVCRGQGNFEPLRILGDGRLLVQKFHSNGNHDLVAVAVESGEEQLLTAHSGNAAYVPDVPVGEHQLLCLSNQDREFQTPGILDTREGGWSPLFDCPWETEQIALHKDSSRLACVFNRDGDSQLGLFDVRNQAWIDCPALPAGVVSQLEWVGPERLRFLLSGPDRPNSYGEIDLHKGSLTWLKESALPQPRPQSTFVHPQHVEYPSFDGQKIPALFYRAPGPSRGAVVQLHGGPESQSRPRFEPVVQHLLDQGISVLAPNVRGSTGYGRSYLEADNGLLRQDAIQDVKYASIHLKQQGFRDGQIAVMGGSYGGYLALAALAFAPEEGWAAGISNVGMSNLETFLKNTSPWRRQNRIAEYGDPEQEAQTLRDLSPIHQVDRIQAPLLVIQGANDTRVPRSEADQLVEALRGREQPVEYLLFPDEGHGITQMKNAVEAYGRTAEFLLRHLE